MRPLVEQLGQRLEDLSREERVAEAMKIAKDEALDAYDRVFVWGARTAESLFRLAGMPEVAKRVRPSVRRPGLTAEVASDDTVTDDDSVTDIDEPEVPEEDDAPEASPEDPATDPPVDE